MFWFRLGNEFSDKTRISARFCGTGVFRIWEVNVVPFSPFLFSISSFVGGFQMDMGWDGSNWCFFVFSFFFFWFFFWLLLCRASLSLYILHFFSFVGFTDFLPCLTFFPSLFLHEEQKVHLYRDVALLFFFPKEYIGSSKSLGTLFFFSLVFPPLFSLVLSLCLQGTAVHKYSTVQSIPTSSYST